MKVIYPQIVTFISLLTLLLLLTVVARAAGESLPRYLVSSGGGLTQTSDLRLSNAIGQPVAGLARNGLNLCAGYLCQSTSGTDNSVYLPVVIR